jgi:hypothetical protein
MGGTWVNWGQAHAWREISRYNMRKELEVSQDYSHGVNHFSLITEERGKTNLSHEEEVRYPLIVVLAICHINVSNLSPGPHHRIGTPKVR